MLYRLEIENFYSIRDKQVIDLRVPANLRDYPERFVPIFLGSEMQAPKVVALFGPNGSGKTNVLRALAFISWFLTSSFQRNEPSFPCECFNDTEAANLPVRLAVELGGPTALTHATAQRIEMDETVAFGLFRYEIELTAKDGLVTAVACERLSHKPGGTGKWTRVFERRAGQKLLGSKTFPLTKFTKIIDKIRDNASVIATLALFDHEPSTEIQRMARKVTKNITEQRIDHSDQAIQELLVANPDIFVALNRQIQRIDIGVESISINPDRNFPKLMFKHSGLGKEMTMASESQGTLSFMKIFPLLFEVLVNGGIAIVDELDAAIHALVLPEILRWFYDPHQNQKNAQLWITCHNASLLDDLVKEEIVLAEKDPQGRTRVFSLMDVEGVRRSDNLYRKYLGGVYGAVPHIG